MPPLPPHSRVRRPACDAVSPQLDAALDGALSDDATARLAAHLAACPACRAELRQRRALLSRLRRAAEGTSPRAPAELRARVATLAARTRPSAGGDAP